MQLCYWRNAMTTRWAERTWTALILGSFNNQILSLYFGWLVRTKWPGTLKSLIWKKLEVIANAVMHYLKSCERTVSVLRASMDARLSEWMLPWEDSNSYSFSWLRKKKTPQMREEKFDIFEKKFHVFRKITFSFRLPRCKKKCLSTRHQTHYDSY